MLSCSDVLEMLLCLRNFSVFLCNLFGLLWGFKLIFLCIMGCRLDIFKHFLLFSIENYSSMWGMKMRICIQVLGAF